MPDYTYEVYICSSHEDQKYRADARLQVEAENILDAARQLHAFFSDGSGAGSVEYFVDELERQSRRSQS